MPVFFATVVVTNSITHTLFEMVFFFFVIFLTKVAEKHIEEPQTEQKQEKRRKNKVYVLYAKKAK